MSKAIEEAKIEEVVADVQVEEGIERPYTLRKLMDADLFPLLQLLRKLGFKEIKDSAKTSLEEARKNNQFDPAIYETEAEKEEAFDKFRDAVGIDVVLGMADFLISKLDTHSNDIYEFFSNLAGIPAEDIKQMEFGTLPLMIYDAFSEVKNTAFFKVLIKLL